MCDKPYGRLTESVDSERGPVRLIWGKLKNKRASCTHTKPQNPPPLSLKSECQWSHAKNSIRGLSRKRVKTSGRPGPSLIRSNTSACTATTYRRHALQAKNRKKRRKEDPDWREKERVSSAAYRKKKKMSLPHCFENIETIQ